MGIVTIAAGKIGMGASNGWNLVAPTANGIFPQARLVPACLRFAVLKLIHHDSILHRMAILATNRVRR